MIPVNSENCVETATVMKKLSEAFDLGEVKFKPQKVSGNRAMSIAYIDARHVMDRLDEVMGIANWKDEYSVLPGGSEVECRLSLRIGGEWITKADVGGMSEQPDGGDRMKAAYSDALKRAAIKFGVGRFLYRTQQTWQDYDPVKKRFVHQLKLVQRGDSFLVEPATQADIKAANAPAEKPAQANDAPPTPQQIVYDLDHSDRAQFEKIVTFLKQHKLNDADRAIVTPAYQKARARLFPEKATASK